jgi:hypothetical protein
MTTYDFIALCISLAALLVSVLAYRHSELKFKQLCEDRSAPKWEFAHSLSARYMLINHGSLPVYDVCVEMPEAGADYSLYKFGHIDAKASVDMKVVFHMGSQNHDAIVTWRDDKNRFHTWRTSIPQPQ